MTFEQAKWIIICVGGELMCPYHPTGLSSDELYLKAMRILENYPFPDEAKSVWDEVMENRSKDTYERHCH